MQQRQGESWPPEIAFALHGLNKTDSHGPEELCVFDFKNKMFVCIVEDEPLAVDE